MTAPSPPSPPGRSSVLPLSALGAGDLDRAGGKAANLGELLRAGLPVPPGAVITTDAYVAAAHRAGLDALLADPAAPPSALRRALEDAPIAADLDREIRSAYQGLRGPGEDEARVAVRSSATAEDLPGAAFAGQQDTVLDVRGEEEVLAAVRRCWASLWTDRAVSYRRERGIDPHEVRIAVILQRMVPARWAGVAFTADPVTGARDRLVIDAVPGLGEAVVSGAVTAEHLVVGPAGRVLSRTPGRDPATGAVPAALPHEVLTALLPLARRIDEHFGRPQDIEWAADGSGVQITQARPMTALPPPSVPLSPAQRLQCSVLLEFLPVRPYPLDVTTQIAHGPARMMQGIARFYGVEGLFAGFLREEDGVAVQLLPARARPTARLLATPAKLAARIRRFDPAVWARDPRQQEFLAEIAALEDLDLAALDWQSLLAVPPRAFATLETCRDLRIDYLPGSAAAVARLALLALLLGEHALIADLLGGARTRTADADRALEELADAVRADPALTERMIAARSPEELVRLAADRGHPLLQDGLARFLEEFGRRETTSSMLVSTPTLDECPEIVLGMVRANLARPRDATPRASRSRAARSRLLAHPGLRGPRAADRADRWIRAAQAGVAFREDSHFHFTAALPTLRRALRESGRRLAAAGVLEDPEDVLHLRWEEISAIPAPESLPEARCRELRRAVRRRAARRAELEGVPMLDAARVFPSRGGPGALATGMPSGAGIATGPARIIRGPEDFARLQDGDVLVCPFTNPAWTPLFLRAAAVVVDAGSPGSHAAIVAREQGIPSVTATGTGTRLIEDGALVTVDGTHGRVTPAAGS
ncbi:PEP/pyruvate-binding domain-containing protein [Brachybacterium phenoliresistens]|uniref:Phosphoenolpyruvate synthase n=1 Tax=Brachybacterium phenoliresistens TaxID=396014 RepID=Z9JWL4_9MICO|nr:PEP/pyruvate-binding domain-containing protein [Brachybacterium phenoliresistens]EWS82775.1 phosphoenolpyruvate synthase [Brachybacterium phenoliresistens]